MNIKLVAFGIAREILGNSIMVFTLNKEQSIGTLKETLVNQYPEFEKLRNLRFAIDEEYRKDDYLIQPNDEVVIIPPVSGG